MSPPPPPPPRLAWEQGPMSFGGLFQSWWLFITAPGRAYSLAPAEDWRRWLMFALALNLAVALGILLLFASRLAQAPPAGGPTGGMLASAGLTLLFHMVNMTFQAGLINVLLKFITRTQVGFFAAFRTACYAQSPRLIGLVTPMVGPAPELVYFVWNLALMVVGIKAAYNISLPRSLAVNLIYGVLSIYLAMVFR